MIKNRSLALGLWRAIRVAGLAPLALRFHSSSGLKKVGWYRSFRVGRPVDAKSQVLPWWTYSVIEFLEPRLASSMRVIEFGAGYSTLWLSSKVGEVVSFENNVTWAASLMPRLPRNARIISSDNFEHLFTSPPPDVGNFDLAVIDCDGDRIGCGKLALARYLTQDGVVLWDNTNGPDWPAIRDLMQQRGFREISFSGMAPHSCPN